MTNVRKTSQLEPVVRFKGFTDVWEKRKLGELGNFVRDSINPQDTPAEKFAEYSMPAFDNGRTPQVVLGKMMQSLRLKISGNVLLINKLNVRQRRIWWLREVEDNAVTSSEFVPFTSDKVALGLLEQIMLSDKVTRDMEAMSSGTSNSQKRITPSDLAKYELGIPEEVIEQTKIGAFFSRLDSLIAVNQRRTDNLQKLKKALLQRMFVSGDNGIPAVRFTGFTDVWEKRKLLSLVEVNSGRDYKHLHTGNIPVYGTGGHMLDVDESLSEEDGIGIGRKGTIDSPYILRAPYWTVDTLFYVIPKKNHDLNFLYAVFQQINWKKYDESTGVPSLSKQTINNIEVSFTSDIEQRKIGTFFTKLDNLIAVNQRKVELLKKLKQSYLQKMFV